MSKFESVVAAALAGVVVSGVAAQDAVQWRIEDGGNGHWYLLDATVGISWNEARSRALARGGDLASIENAEENALLAGPVLGDLQLDGGNQVWLGGRKSGSWEWIDGSKFNFTSWDCPGAGSPCQPDNTGTAMTALRSFDQVLYWNDTPAGFTGDAAGFFIEWSTDCNGDGIVDYGQIVDGTCDDTNDAGVPDCCDAGQACDPCPADLNDDGLVGPPDLGILLALWDTDGTPNSADINGDGTVNASDLGPLLGAWGVCP